MSEQTLYSGKPISVLVWGEGLSQIRDERGDDAWVPTKNIKKFIEGEKKRRVSAKEASNEQVRQLLESFHGVPVTKDRLLIRCEEMFPRQDDEGNAWPYDSNQVEMPFIPDNEGGLWDIGEAVWVGKGPTRSGEMADLWILESYATSDQIQTSKNELLTRLRRKIEIVIRKYEQEIPNLQRRIAAKEHGR